MTLKMTLRPPDLTDKNFIFNSWLKSYRSSDFAKDQCNAVYYDNYKIIVENILKRSKIVVACNPQDYTQVYGYIVYEDLPADNLLVHFVYTKYTYRKFGVAKKLLVSIRRSNNPILISHYVKSLEKIKDKITFIYDPFKGLYDSFGGLNG